MNDFINNEIGSDVFNYNDTSNPPNLMKFNHYQASAMFILDWSNS
jgi:hypothetical protein